MTGVELVNLIIMPVIAILAIVWGVKNNNKNITHDNEKELWKAIKATQSDLNDKYWDSDRVKEYYELSTKPLIMNVQYLESQVEAANNKLDIIIKNLKPSD